MQAKVTRRAQLTGDNGRFRKTSGRWLGDEAEQSEWHSAERGSERIPCRKKWEEGTGGMEMENNKEQRWWFKKVGPAQAPLQIRAGRGRARRTLKAGSQSALSAISPPPDRPTIDETTHC